MANTSIKDKLVVITGGAIGIGLEIAKNCLEKCAKTVIILDINEVKGKEIENALNSKYGQNKVKFIKCDVVKDLEDVSRQIIEKYKQIDVLINNAGIARETCWKTLIDINVTALIGWTDTFLKHMRKDKGGKGGVIINVASIYGLQAEPYIPIYTASKHAVVGFTRSVGHTKNYVLTGVRVVAACPGFTKTELTGHLDPYIQPENVFEDYAKTVQWQTADVVGAATIEVFEKAESGTAWIINGGKPIKKAEFSY